MTRPRLGVAAAVLLGWALLIYLVPLAVGLAVGATPVRVISSGIFFDQSRTTLLGYRLILWGPVLVGVAMGVAALFLRATRFGVAFGLTGTAYAATLLVVGGGLGLGPAGTLLIGTDLRWIWRLCVVAAGLMIGLTIPLALRTRAEGNGLEFSRLQRELLYTAAALGIVILLFAPGPFLGKMMAGMGSWLGSLVWLVAL